MYGSSQICKHLVTFMMVTLQINANSMFLQPLLPGTHSTRTDLSWWRWRWKCGDGNVEMEMEKHYKRKQQRQSLSQQQAGSKTTYEDQVTSMYIFPLFKDLFWYNVNNLNKLVLTGGRYWVGKLDRSCISKLVRICTMPNIGAILPSLLSEKQSKVNISIRNETNWIFLFI